VKYIGVIHENSHWEFENNLEEENMKYFALDKFYKDVFLHYAEMDLFADNESMLRLANRKEILEIINKHNFQSCTHADAELFIHDLMGALRAIDQFKSSVKLFTQSGFAEHESSITADDLLVEFDYVAIAKRRNLKLPSELKS
jgi:hypothetical protein